VLRQLVLVGKRRPCLVHRRLRHEQLGAEDFPLVLEGAMRARQADASGGPFLGNVTSRLPS